MVFLTYCDENQRDTLIEMATEAGQKPFNSVFNNKTSMARQFANVRRAGYAKRVEKSRSVILVPLFSSDRIFACLAMRYYSSALKGPQIKKEILPLLFDAALKIGNEFQSSLSKR